MKVRLHRNSLRLRLTPAEVRQLRDTGRVETATHVPGGVLRCVLRVDPEVLRIAAMLEGADLLVTLGRRAAMEWADGDAVGLAQEIAAGGGRTLRVLIEKDFDCLHEEEGQAGEVFYPNPGKAGGSLDSSAVG